MDARVAFLRRGLLAAALALAIGGQARCGLDPTTDARGGRDTLVYAAPVDATTLDPHQATERISEQVIRMVYSPLVAYDEQLRIVGQLAERWERSDDGKTWTFWLREGVRFHDGAPLTAHTVKASFERVLDRRQAHPRQPLFEMIERVEAPDPHSVQIITAHPFAPLEAHLAHPAASIVHPTLAAQSGRSYGRFAETTSGTGPYRVTRWVKDREIVLERHDDYWGERAPTRRVVYRPILLPAARSIALETGDVDVISDVPSLDLSRLRPNSELRVVQVPSVVNMGFHFHARRPPFTDRRVRRAVSHAIDRQAIVDGLLGGVASAARGPLAPAVRGHAALGPVTYDPQRARALLAKAGLPHGFDTVITTTPRYPEAVDVAEAVAAQLAKVGVRASIEVLEHGIWSSIYRGASPEENPLAIFRMVNAPSTGQADWALRRLFFTQPTNENNYGYYSNPEFDRTILQAMQELDPGRRQALYRRAQEILYLEDVAALWLYDYEFVVVSRATVTGVTTSPIGLVTFERAVVAH